MELQSGLGVMTIIMNTMMLNPVDRYMTRTMGLRHGLLLRHLMLSVWQH